MQVFRSRNLAFAALLLGMAMASLDTNVVVAALPSVGTALGDPDAVAGVTAAYLLAVAVATPLHGDLGDRWGRRVMFGLSVTVFAVGSLACALAPSVPVLIGLRALQGLGGSGLIVAAVSAMAELFDREEMLRRQGWLTAVFALSSVGGAPLGAFLAAAAGWQWIFLVNLPACAVALGLGVVALPAGHAAPTGRGFDAMGAVLVAVAGTAVVLLGSSPALARSAVGAPALLVVAVAATVVLVRVERRAATPLIPPRIFTDPGLARAVLATLAAGVALFGSFTFVPLALTDGAAVPAAQVGLLLLPMGLGQLLATSGFSALARRRPAVPAWGRLGLLAGTAGLLGVAAVPLLTPGPARLAVAAVALALAGAALGLCLQAYTLVAQARAERDILGATMATVSFVRQIGGSLGIAVFGWIALLLGGRAGLVGVFVVAALALLVGAALAPGARHDRPVRPAEVAG